MVKRAVYNNKAFKILNRYEHNFSNNEVTFNDITIDFTGASIADIPFKYQEIKIIQADSEENILNGTIIFTGYLDNIQLSNMKMKNEFRELTLTLLSPLKLATKRCVSLIGNYELKTAILRLIQPLLDDGFILKEMNITEGQIKINYVLETIENCMNDIGFKRNIFWYINEKKEIFINSIDYLFGMPIAKKIDENYKEQGFLKIQPYISNTDYANILNFKNVRLFYNQRDYCYNNEVQNSVGGYPLINLPKTIKKGDIVKFNNPIVVDEDTLREVQKEDDDNLSTQHSALGLTIFIGDVFNTYDIYISTDKSSSDYNKYVIKGDITFSDSEGDEGDIVLQRDSFFSNLITGFKWNGENATIIEIRSDTALRYTTMRFMYTAEINKLKGIISDSGQIEKTIDYNEKWITFPQLITYARSLMMQNTNIVNEVVLEYDIDPNLKIGDLVNIKAPSFFTEGVFAVKKIRYVYYNDIRQNWQITLKSTDFITTYIDMFRPIEREENQSHIDTVILSEYVEEKINETHEIEISEV